MTEQVDEIYLKDANKEVKAACIRLYEVTFGVTFAIEDLEHVFDTFPMEIWTTLDKYTTIEECGIRALDTFDREPLYEVLWARIFGYALPRYTTEEISEKLKAFLEDEKNEGWGSRLYDFSEVAKTDKHRMYWSGEDLFILNSFELPEPVKISGHAFIVNALTDYLEERKEELETYVKKHFKTQVEEYKANKKNVD